MNISSRRTALLFFTALACCFNTLQAGVQSTCYVDPNFGSDSNPGTLPAPFKTIEKARDMVRTINSNMTGDIIIYLRGGIYSLSQAITLDARDSGNSGFRVIYRNYPHEEPIIDGGASITGWTSVSNGIYSANAQGMDFMQMYVDNMPTQRARQPNAGSAYHTIQNKTSQKTTLINSSEIEPWDNLHRVQMIIGSSWSCCRQRIDSFTTMATTSTVTFLEPDRTSYYRWAPGGPSSSYFFENNFSFLDLPGEWFLDVDTDTVYYMPEEDENMATANVTVPQLEELLHIDGTENVTLFGITFQHTSWMEPNEQGMIQRQGSMRVLTDQQGTTTEENITPPAVYLKSARNMRIERCIFHKMGGAAMGFDTSTQSNLVIGNVFSEIAETAVIYDMNNDPNEADALMSSLDVFDSNYFYKIGTLYYAGTAIFCFWPDRITITHNEISQVNGLGINIGWAGITNPSVLNGAVVTKNRIHDTAMRAKNSAGIHTKSNQRGLLISENWIYNGQCRNWWDTGSTRPVFGVYLDDETTDGTICSNVFLLQGTTIRDKTKANSKFDNDSQDQTIKDQSGLRPEYEDIRQFWRGGPIGRDLDPGEAYGGEEIPLGLLFENTFDAEPVGSQPAGYVYDTSGGTIQVVDDPGNGNHSLRLADTNANDTVGTVLSRFFDAQSGTVSCSFKVKGSTGTGMDFLFSFIDASTNQACVVGINPQGKFSYQYQIGENTAISNYSKNVWYEFLVEADVEKQVYSLWIDGKLMLRDSALPMPTGPITGIEFVNLRSTSQFYIDSIRVESSSRPSDLVTTNGTPFYWIDRFYNTSGWTVDDYNSVDQADGDHDGLPLWKEYFAQTNPTDGNNVFQLTRSQAATNAISFNFMTARDRIYTLQTSSKLESGAWTNSPASGLVRFTGNGGLKNIQDNLTDNTRFYRIKVEPDM